MVSEVLICIAIEAAFVSMQIRFLRNVIGHDLGDCRLISDRYMERAIVTAALVKPDDGALPGRAGLAALGEGAALTLRRDARRRDFPMIGLIGLHDLALAA